MTGRRLVVVRHAKTEPYQHPDHTRRLTAGGRRAALDLGRRLGAAEVLPDYALVSSATRTRQTWAAISEGLAASMPSWSEIPAEFTDALYHAGPEDVVDAVRWVPVEARTVLYVGHNPTAGELPHLLDDGTGDRAALDEIAYGYPTAAVTVVEVEVPWADLRMGRARVTRFFVGSRD